MPQQSSDVIRACLSGKFYREDGDINIACPRCGCDYVRVASAGTLEGSDPLEAVRAYSGTERIGSTSARRSSVAVTLSCDDCRSLFTIEFEQHKGVTLLNAWVRSERKPQEPAE